MKASLSQTILAHPSSEVIDGFLCGTSKMLSCAPQFRLPNLTHMGMDGRAGQSRLSNITHCCKTSRMRRLTDIILAWAPMRQMNMKASTPWAIRGWISTFCVYGETMWLKISRSATLMSRHWLRVSHKNFKGVGIPVVRFERPQLLRIMNWNIAQRVSAARQYKSDHRALYLPVTVWRFCNRSPQSLPSVCERNGLHW